MVKAPTNSAGLSNEEQGHVEAAVLEFDRRWTGDLLARYAERLAPGKLRKPALEALVSVDLERRWAAGDRRKVEDYLRQFPELGQSSNASAELILSEYQARESTESPLDVAELRSRFPTQAQRVERLIERARDSHGEREADAVQASIDTSRLGSDTHPGRAASNVELPEQFGRYRILRRLGSGAMGAVYLAHDDQLDRRVALKTPKIGEDDEGGAMVERFYREARAAANLRHHNICPVHDVGQIDGVHYISMAYIDGRPLSDYTKSEQLIQPRAAAVTLRKLALALASAHAVGIVHRDLKPANVMVDKRREPVVMDFGLARRSEGAEQANITHSGVILGTPAYMSPEQVTGDPAAVGPASDQYSMGVILYEMLCGQLPFKGAVTAVIGQIMSQSPLAPSERRSGVDKGLEAICLRMMAKNPADRFASLNEVAAALGEWLKSQANESTSPAGQSDEAFAVATPSATPIGSPGPPAESATASPSVSAPRDASPVPATQPIVRESSSAQKARGKRSWWLAGFAFAGILMLGVVLMLPTPEGMLRVEISDPSLDVYIDGRSVEIKDNRWEGRKKAKKHGLTLKLGGVEVPFDATEGEFVTKEGKLQIQLNDAELVSDRFEVSRRGTTVLKISLRPSDSRGDEFPQLRAVGAQTGGALTKSFGLAEPRLVASFYHIGSLKTGAGYFAGMSPDGKQVFARMSSDPLEILSAETGRSVRVPVAMETATCIDFDGSGHQFATGHTDGTIRVWDAKTNAPVGQPFALPDAATIKWVSLSNDGSRLFAVVSGQPLMLHSWRVDSRDKIAEPRAISAATEKRWLNYASSKSIFVAAADDGATIAAFDQRKPANELLRWDVVTGKSQRIDLQPSDGEFDSIYGFALSPQGDRVATVSKNGKCRLFDLDGGEEVWSRSYTGTLVAVRFASSGDYLALSSGIAGSDDMHLLEAATGGELLRWRVPLDMDAKGSLASGESTKSRSSSQKYGGWVPYLAFSRDGSRLLTAGINNPVSIWSLSAEDKLPPTVVSRHTTGSATDSAQPVSGGKVESQTGDPETEREIAQFFLDLGCSVQLEGEKYLYQLPAGDVKVTGVACYTESQVKDEHIPLLLKLPRLSTLLFYACDVTDEGYALLADKQSLSRLAFTWSSLGDKGLAALSRLENLRRLSLLHTKVTDDGLAALGSMPQLAKVSISESWSKKHHRTYGPTFITSEGLAHLANVKKLEYLYVYGPRFNDQAAKHIANLTDLPDFTDLHIWADDLTDDGVGSLSSLPKLQQLTIYAPAVTSECIEELQKALPKGCRIKVRHTIDGADMNGMEEDMPDAESDLPRSE